ncbi:MAG: type III-A CRISPR-associated RAMP protein Csm4 [Thermodesulfobacteriota bacterium]
MKTYNLKLTPLTSFQSIPSSDTLFGAICWGIKRLYGEEKLLEILQGFSTNKPKFVLSSSFPLLQNEPGTSVAFYSKPINQGLSSKDIEEIGRTAKEKKFKKAMVEVITKYKKFKKAEYLSESLFNDAVNGMPERALFEGYLSDKIKPTGSMLMRDSEYTAIFAEFDSKVYKASTVQKNYIDRLTMSTGEEGQTFYQQETYTSNIFNFHFLVMTDDTEFLLPVFKYLEDKGIGGNRSTGKGRFKIEIMGEKVLPNSSNSKTFASLSRYIPQADEIEWESDRNFYEVFPYRSKVDSEAEFKGEDIWKSKVMYLKEGSCLEAKVRKECYGRIPVVKEIDGYKIYQNGLTIPVFGNFGGIS